MEMEKTQAAQTRQRPWLIAAGALLAVAAAVTATVLYLSRKPPPDGGAPVLELLKERETVSVVPPVRFTDITGPAGIRFVHVNGAFGKKLLPETMGSGCAFIDYDNDGRQDLLLINSNYWPGHEDKQKPAPTMALYRNMGPGKSFEDVTEAAGLKISLYGMGVTVGDYDNDGWPDVFITAVGGSHLFHNVPGARAGERRFEDVTAQADIVENVAVLPKTGGFLSHKADIAFSSSATFVDYDGDGFLDLFVCNYVKWSPKIDLDLDFKLVGKGRAYGRPTAFVGVHCALYHNEKNGKFTDATTKAGIPVFDIKGLPLGKALGVIAWDVNEDGHPDLFVANDTVRNFFFRNRGNGTFEEIGEPCGVAYSEGNTRGAMGIDKGEFWPGRWALIVGNFANEPDTFFCLDHPKELNFSDGAVSVGISGPSRLLLKFGTFFFDYDLDGRQDILTCNGHLEPDISLVQEGEKYKQPAQLFWNRGGDKRFLGFADVSPEQAGSDLFFPIVGRGCAFADIDGDGDLDVVLTENNGPARLLRNDNATKNHWIRLKLEGNGQTSNRSAIGARVIVEAGGLVQRQEVTSGRGYLSQSELPLTFGLGQISKVDKVTIHWPGKNAGAPTVLTNLEINKEHLIKQTGTK